MKQTDGIRTQEEETQAAKVAVPLHAQQVPPGPKGEPLLGNARAFQRDALGFLVHVAREYGDIAYYHIFNQAGYSVNHPNYVKRVLQENHMNYDKRAIDYNTMRQIIKRGLLTSDGSEWMRERRLIQPAFHHQRIMNDYMKCMVKAIEEMLERWHLYAKQDQPVDILHEMLRLALSIICNSLFSSEISDSIKKIERSFLAISQYFYDFISFPFIPPYLPIPRNLHFKKALHELDTVIYSIIRERRKTQKDVGDLLSKLLDTHDEDGSYLDDELLRDELLTLLLAGHDTVANSMTWMWYLLSQHPDVEARLHSEVASVLGGRLPTAADMPNLSYSHMVISETLRLYPPVWAMGRRAIKDDMLGEYHIPANSHIFVCSYTTHRHPEFWDDSERFDPERFTPENIKKRPKFAYFPFGGGPRLCIGNNVALLEENLMLSSAIQRFHLEHIPEHKVEKVARITLAPRHGMLMKITKR